MTGYHTGNRLKREAKIACGRGLASARGQVDIFKQALRFFSALPGPVTAIQRPGLPHSQVAGNIFPTEKQHTLNRSALFLALPLHRKPHAVPLHHKNKNWSVRLGVRTVDFHSTNRGSIPLRTTRKPPPKGGFFFVYQPLTQFRSVGCVTRNE